MLSGKCFTRLMHCMKLSLVRLTSFLKPSDIARCQKRNNNLCGMMFHAKYENERRITICLLSGSFASSTQSLTSRLVRALQSPSPSEIAAKIDMRENGSEMVQAKYKVVKQEQGCKIVRTNS